MKVLLISSSPRKDKSQTFILARQLLSVCANEGAETEVVHLCDLKLEFCRHCEACHLKILQCPIKDDAGAIIKKILGAEGIVFASPNYINQITASMKCLFERASHFIHCKRLLGKYMAAVVCSGSGRDEPVLDYIQYCGYSFGALCVGVVSSQVPVSDVKKKEAADLGKALVLAIKEKKAFPKQQELVERGRQYFKEVIKARKDDWLEEYQYWLDKGWLS